MMKNCLLFEINRVEIALSKGIINFPFSIVRLPFASSNIPSVVFYNCVGAEILRIGRVSSNLENFKTDGKELLNTLVNHLELKVK